MLMPPSAENENSFVPERLTVEVSSTLSPSIMQHRPEHVNVLLRLSMMNGMQMQLEATLKLLCEFTKEIVSFERALVYFWDEAEEQSQLRIFDDLPDSSSGELATGNVFDYWCRRYGRPLLVKWNDHPQADEILTIMESCSALVVPVLVNNRVMGSIQVFSKEQQAFAKEDAQLVWMLARIAENLLTREHVNEGLIHFAFTDHLTGLRTRGYFEQQLELEIKRAERKQEKFVLLMLDIDHFKCLNDTYGHHVGDEVLRALAAVLVKDMREVDTVARYGGEEFVMILPDTTQVEAEAVAQRIRKAVEQTKLTATLNPPPPDPISISIGLAVFDVDATHKRELIELADAALYWAKGQGRNRVVSYSEMVNQQRRKVS